MSIQRVILCGCAILAWFGAQENLWAQKKGLIHMPPAIELSNGQKAVFVDIRWAQYKIIVDIDQKVVEVWTNLEFQNWEEGLPIIDLVPNPLAVTMADQQLKTREIRTPDKATYLRVIEANVSPGNHLVQIRHRLTKGVSFGDGSAGLAFWYSDLDDREFLEQFLPTNLEYDLYPMFFRIELRGATQVHRVFTNGKLTALDEGVWNVEFPEHFSASSPFFHLGRESDFEVQATTFASKKGKPLPVIIYGKEGVDIEDFTSRAHETLKELERDYGAFPHDKLVVYAAPSFPGGMEYSGATITNLWALSHEITHSYFGRGLIPANGNSGWMDEAIASWRDANYPRLDDPGYSRANLAKFSPYRRTTTRDAYTKGRNFMGYLDSRIADKKQSGLKVFLGEFLREKLFQPITTNTFQLALEAYMSDTLGDEFNQYVYDANHVWGLQSVEPLAPRSPYHPRIDFSQWIELL